MKVVVYPADNHGCGHHRLIWPGEMLAARGHNVTVVRPENRAIRFTVRNGDVVGADLNDDVDVVVFQRVTHKYLAQAVPVIRRQGVAVVVDVDDDLNAIHPGNPAWWTLHPRHFGSRRDDDKIHMHSWRFLNDACRDATLVTVSTPALLDRYATHGRGVVLRNYLADHYYGIEHEDSDEVCWPASLHSHPDDPAAVGNAISRHVAQGATFVSYGQANKVARAFGLNDEGLPPYAPKVEIHEWPRAIARHGIGICPLADTRFNEAKSWLKPLELAAVGVPWIGSPRAEYRRLYELGCGVLADRPKEWYRALNQLRHSRTRRLELSAAGRAVAETLRLRDHAWRWLEAWERAFKIERVNRSAFAR